MSDLKVLIEHPEVERKIPPEVQDQLRERERARCRKSLFYLARVVLGFDKLTGHLHKKVCDFIQNPKYKRKLLLLPRGHYKSTIATIAYPIWLIIQEDIRKLPVSGSFRDYEKADFLPSPYPEPGSNITILIANETATGAQHFLDAIKNVFEKNKFFQFLFPELIPNWGKNLKRWNQQEMLVPRTKTKPEATIETIGVGGAVQGRHYHVQIHDDLIGKNAMNSPILMAQTREWLTYSESLFVNPSQDTHIIVGTRWAIGDIYADIKKDERYKVLEIPAIKDGKPVFPEEFSMEFFEAIRRKDPFYFRSQYLNDPRDPSSTDLDASRLQTFELKPEIGTRGYIYLTNKDGYLEKLAIDSLFGVMSLDPASTEYKRSGSKKAIVVAVRDSKGRTFIVDGWTSFGSHDEMFEAVFSLYTKWKYQLGIETIAFQKFLIWAFNKEERRRRIWIPKKELGSATKLAKPDRIRSAIQNDLNLGLIYVCSKGPESSIQIGKQLIEEMDTFPEGKIDVLDAFAYCMQMLSDISPLSEEEEEEWKALDEIEIQKRNIVTGY